MSISGIASDPTVNQNYASSPFQQVRKDFAALKSSLNSGDLSGAQNAFATLTQDLQSVTQAQTGQQTGTNSTIDNDLSVIGAALQKGDITGAQNAFQTLQKDMQQMRQAQGGQQARGAQHHRHHHHGGSAQNSTSNPFTDLSAIGSALQSNDLSGAQNVFATLMKDLQNSLATVGNGSASQAVGTNVDVAT